MKGEYSPYKIVHHLGKIKDLKKGIQSVPLQIQMVPSNGCNQRCSFCAYRMKDYLSNEIFNESDILSYSKIIECLNNFVTMGVKSVQYTGGGEPLVHPDIKRIFRETFSRNLEVALVSNGQALDEETCDILGDATWTRISVDASQSDIYGLIRNVPSKTFDRVADNIKSLVRHKRSNIIGVGFVVERENYKGILEAAKFFKDIGVDNFRISAAFTPMGHKYFEYFEREAKDLSHEAESLSDENFTVFNLFNDRIEDMFQGTQDYEFCPIKELMAYVGADYNVYTCCTLAYNQKGLIGSIKDMSFEDLWNSDIKIEKFNNHKPCSHCKFPCMYKSKNEFINYCIDKNAKHVNFI